jgi:AcrR family transcriptional regulator
MGSRAPEPASRGSGRGFSPGKLSPGPGLGPKDVAAHQLARIRSATIGIVAENGYEALKVRDIVGYAEVSTRAFYELFSSKDDCFQQTYELISRRATRRIIAAQAGERDWRKRPRLIFDEFVRVLEMHPEGARLALVEAYAADDSALERAWRAERIFEGMLAECFARAPGGVVIPPLIVEGMVAGVASISRTHLLAGKISELTIAGDELVAWVLCYPDEVALDLAELDRQSVWRDTTLEPLTPSAAVARKVRTWPASGDRGLILDAVAELAATHGYSKLTAPRVRAAASVSRRKFEAYFDDIEDCYLAALELHAGEAIAHATRAQAAARSWAGGVYRAIAALCDTLAGNPFLARVCLSDDFPPGPDGTRSRERLISAISELLSSNTSHPAPPTPLVAEASTGAIWTLFHHHLIRDRYLRRQISATLSYLATVPVVGAPAAVVAIRAEQAPA